MKFDLPSFLVENLPTTWSLPAFTSTTTSTSTSGASTSSKDDDTSLLLAAAGLTALIGAGWWYQVNRKHPWPIVGGELPFLGHLLYIGHPKRFQRKMEDWSEKYGSETGIFEVNPGVYPKFFVLCREDTAWEIMAKRPFVVTRAPHVRDVARSVGVTGLFAAEGDDWRQQMRLVGPALNRKSVQDYMPVFQEMSAKAIARWRDEALAAVKGNKRKVLDPEADMGRVLADTFFIVALEQYYDILNCPDSPVARDVQIAMDGSNFRSLMPVPYWHIPIVGQYLDGVGFSVKRLQKLMNKILDDYEARAETREKKRSFISKLYETMKSEKTKMSRDLVIGNMITVLIAGVDTTAKSLGAGMYHLASDPDMYQELREEALKVDIPNVTLDHMFESMPKIKSFLHEMHRFFGVPIQLLEAAEEVTLQGTKLPKGSHFMVLLQYITTQSIAPTKDVPLGPQGEPAHVFCWRRWLKEDAKTGKLSTPTPAGNGVMSFGVGVRDCPGRVYSEAFTFLMLLRFLVTFESIELTAPAKSFYKVYDVITHYNKPIKLHVKVAKEAAAGKA